jgi:2-methylcitrate dehydratase PrpD
MISGSEGIDSVAALVRFVGKARFHDLPPDVIDITKRAILDTLGVALAASGIGEGCNEMVAFAMSQAGHAEATIWSNGRRVCASMAALANGALARALDYDDLMDSPQAHVSVCTVPAALAMAERHSRPVTGKELVVALAVACEIQHRLALAMVRGQDPAVFPVMLATQIFGYFSAAAAAGRLLRLSPEKMQSAFGLALMQAAGTEEMVVHSANSMGKCIYAAFCNQGGLQAAMLADRGVTAQGEIFDGTAGLFAAYYGRHYDRPTLTEGLGTTYLSTARCFKFWPGTLITHPFIEAALKLVAQNGIGPSDIAAVRARVGVWGKAMSEPLAERKRPPTSAAAMNSLPFILAKVLANGTVTLADFKERRRKQPAALAMAEKFSYRYEPELNNASGLEAGTLEIETTDGRQYTVAAEPPRGHPQRPLSFDEIAEKFARNIRYAAVVPDLRRVEKFTDCVRNLEKINDVRGLVATLVGRRGLRGPAQQARTNG